MFLGNRDLTSISKVSEASKIRAIVCNVCVATGPWTNKVGTGDLKRVEKHEGGFKGEGWYRPYIVKARK